MQSFPSPPAHIGVRINTSDRGREATAFIGREAAMPITDLLSVFHGRQRAPRQAKAAASRPHLKVPRSLRNPALMMINWEVGVDVPSSRLKLYESKYQLEAELDPASILRGRYSPEQG